jgi:hypothetical protein
VRRSQNIFRFAKHRAIGLREASKHAGLNSLGCCAPLFVLLTSARKQLVGIGGSPALLQQLAEKKSCVPCVERILPSFERSQRSAEAPLCRSMLPARHHSAGFVEHADGACVDH